MAAAMQLILLAWSNACSNAFCVDGEYSKRRIPGNMRSSLRWVDVWIRWGGSNAIGMDCPAYLTTMNGTIGQRGKLF